MERNIRLNWETITGEARRRREARGLTQLRLATLAKVSRATVVRFEANKADIQLSSAFRILGVLDMLDRKREGSLLIRTGGADDPNLYVVMFAPHTGGPTALEPRQVHGSEELARLLDDLHVDSDSQERALHELRRTGSTSVSDGVLLSSDELQRYWPTQFSSQSSG